MPVTDSIADYITRIRNAGRAKNKTTDINANIQGSVQIVIQEDDRCKPIED